MMYEDAHLESMYEDRFPIEDDPDFNSRDFDMEDEFFDGPIEHPLYDQPGDDWL